MYFKTPSTLLIPILLASQAFGQNYSQCVQNCITENPTSSMCNGDETGQALDDCTCASFTSTTPMIECIKQCPTADQSAFAASLPSECRGALFPGISVTSSSGSGATTGQSTQTAASTDTTSIATSTSATSVSKPASATNAATSTVAKSTNDAIRADPTAIAMVMGIAAAFAF